LFTFLHVLLKISVLEKIKLSIVASISVKGQECISEFINYWSQFLSSEIDLIICVNNSFSFKNTNPYVKVVEYSDNNGMFKFKIQQKKYFAVINNNSNYCLFIHERIVPNDHYFFASLIQKLLQENPDYVAFTIKNLDLSTSLPELYLDLNSDIDNDFYNYLIGLNNSRGCVFNNNKIPAVNGAAFLLSKNYLHLLNNNFRWGEMEDLKLSFDLFKRNLKGLFFNQSFLVSKVYKPGLRNTDKFILLIHYLFKFFYLFFIPFPKIISVYSNIDYLDLIELLKSKKRFVLIDLLHKPFHTSIYKNSLEKVFTTLRSLDESLELKYEITPLGYKISLDD
jgi:hypothetical protein